MRSLAVTICSDGSSDPWRATRIMLQLFSSSILARAGLDSTLNATWTICGSKYIRIHYDEASDTPSARRSWAALYVNLCVLLDVAM